MTSQPPAQLSSGDRVLRPKLGLGQVLDVDAGKAEIFFVDAGLKILLSRFPLPPLVPRPADPRLDRLNLGSSATASSRSYRNVEESIEYFLTKYLGGFYGDEYIDGERNYKEAAAVARRLRGGRGRPATRPLRRRIVGFRGPRPGGAGPWLA